MSNQQEGPVVFVEALYGLVEALASERRLYVPKELQSGHVLVPYEGGPVSLNPIRCINPVKELLFPIWEPVASMPPGQVLCPEAEPFAVLGLKSCDLRAIEILDKVFLDHDLEDGFYLARRALIMIISSDCVEPGPSCFCNLFGGGPYAQGQFDLNISPVDGGFIVQAGSWLGKEFMDRHRDIFKQATEQARA
ncbi:MAG: hypothetical protein QHH07_11890 [Sedimentisphaerales bacterium]|jgi:hypothetical protein|nr:hypothetical protein [Sedimentisphaerales bacterium]